MKLIKAFVGTFAVLFAIQSLAAWAASADQKSVSLQFAKDKSTKDGGSPTCVGGKT